MAITPPRTLNGFAKALAKRLFVETKYMRKALDRNKQLTQIVSLDGEYLTRYNEFKTAYENATKGMSKRDKGKSQKLFALDDGTQFQIRTGSKIVNEEANFRQQKRVLSKLFPNLSDSYELGHKNLSVLRGYIALSLSVFEGDPDFTAQERKALLALHSITGEIDKIDKEMGSQKENKIELVEKLRALAETSPDLTLNWKKDVDLIKGLGANVELELEWKELNQFKGRLSAWVGSMFADIIRGSMDSFYKELGGVDISQMRGSSSIQDDIESMLVDTIDPKKKYKKKRSNSASDTTGKKGKRTKIERKRIKKITPRKESKGPAAAPLALLGILNSKLPETVRGNMVDPRLVNRTGRFANSVKVTDISRTAQGFPSIGYTYEREIYETFELGNRQGSVNRDPRRLIDLSIRQLAAQFALGRFYTRRV